MTVHFVETPASQLRLVNSIEASRRKMFPPKRDLTAPRLGGWTQVDALVAFDPAWKKSVTPEGFAASSASLAHKKKWIRKDEFAAVSSWLTSLALRYLNEDASLPKRDRRLGIENVEQPSEWLFDRLYDRALDVLPNDYAHNLERQVETCVALALEIWTPAWIEKLRAAGRKGGEVSKRPKVWTVEDLERVAGKSKSIQARELGCSVSVISRLRAEAKKAYLTQAQAVSA